MLGRLLILPASVLAVVIAIPFTAGDHPVNLGMVKEPARHVASKVQENYLDHPFRLLPGKDKQQDAAPTRPVVAKPWKPGDVQKGIQVYWENDESKSDAAVRAQARRTVDHLIGLGANAISVSFPFYMSGPTASAVSAGRHTPSPEKMAILIQEAQASKLRITLRPILDERSLHPPDGWRGNIAPASQPDWFTSYMAFLWPYLGLAQTYHVESFVVGAEFNSLDSSDTWSWLIAHAGERFSGELAYDANWDQYVRKARLPKADARGVDAYFKLKVPDDAASDDIAAAWNHWLDKAHKGPHSDIVFSETGIGSRKGAYYQPSNFTIRGTYDPNVQPTWYTGVCDVVKDRKVGGIYFWKMDFDADPTKPTPIEQGHLDFIGYPRSEGAIRTCFGSL